MRLSCQPIALGVIGFFHRALRLHELNGADAHVQNPLDQRRDELFILKNLSYIPWGSMSRQIAR